MHFVLDSTRAVVAATAARARALASWVVHTAPQAAQSMVEYAIIAAIVAAVALSAVGILGTTINRAFTRAETSIDRAGDPTQAQPQVP